MVAISFSVVAQVIKNLPANARDLTLIPGLEDPLEEGMATHSSVLAWRIPLTEEPGRVQSMGSQRVRHDGTTNTKTGITAHVPVTLLRRWSEVRVMILGFMHLSTMWESEVEGEASKIMDLAFYFSADAKKLAIFSWTPDSSLWPLNFKDKFHVFGGCVHTGFHLTALVWFPMPFATLGERRKEEGKTKERRGWRLKTWKDF